MTERGGVSIHPVEQQVSQIPLGELIPGEHVAKPEELVETADNENESMQIEGMGSSDVEAMRLEPVSANEYGSDVENTSAWAQQVQKR